MFILSLPHRLMCNLFVYLRNKSKDIQDEKKEGDSVIDTESIQPTDSLISARSIKFNESLISTRSIQLNDSLISTRSMESKSQKTGVIAEMVARKEVEASGKSTKGIVAEMIASIEAGTFDKSSLVELTERVGTVFESTFKDAPELDPVVEIKQPLVASKDDGDATPVESITKEEEEEEESAEASEEKRKSGEKSVEESTPEESAATEQPSDEDVNTSGKAKMTAPTQDDTSTDTEDELVESSINKSMPEDSETPTKETVLKPEHQADESNAEAAAQPRAGSEVTKTEENGKDESSDADDVQDQKKVTDEQVIVASSSEVVETSMFQRLCCNMDTWLKVSHS